MLHRILEQDSASMIAVNRHLTHISIGKGNKPGSLKMAVDDVTARGFMIGGDLVGFLLLVEREDYEKVVKGIDAEDADPTEPPRAAAAETGGTHD